MDNFRSSIVLKCNNSKISAEVCRQKGPLSTVNCIEMYEAHLAQAIFKPCIFLLVKTVNLCNQLECEQNLFGELLRIHTKLQIVQIPTGFFL